MPGWEYDGEKKVILDVDDCGYPGVIAWVHRHEEGPRLARIPLLERLVRRFVDQHDATWGNVTHLDDTWLRREPPGERVCRCGLCTEARTLLGGTTPS